jgi:hypothetical protein
VRLGHDHAERDAEFDADPRGKRVGQPRDSSGDRVGLAVHVTAHEDAEAHSEVLVGGGAGRRDR